MAREPGRRDLTNDRAQHVVEVEGGCLGEIEGASDRFELTNPPRPGWLLVRHGLGRRERHS